MSKIHANIPSLTWKSVGQVHCPGQWESGSQSWSNAAGGYKPIEMQQEEEYVQIVPLCCTFPNPDPGDWRIKKHHMTQWKKFQKTQK